MTAALAALVLVGAGIAVGVEVGSGGRATGASRGAAHQRPTGNVIDMGSATSIHCLGPVKPGPAHPKPVVAQLFSVKDSSHTSYELGWQVVPYKGLRAYSLGAGGNLLAIEPLTGGRILGYGKGTVTFIGTANAGKVDATIALKAGGTLRVEGHWLCSAAGG